MFKKLNKKGFTLAELLVVVAIIGVLVAVSIPIFTAQLRKAKIATNEANVRAAKAAAVSAYLSSDTSATDAYYEYDISKGVVTVETTETEGTVADSKLTKIGVTIYGGTNDTNNVKTSPSATMVAGKIPGEDGWSMTFGN